MTIDKIIVVLGSVAAIYGIYQYFLGKRDESAPMTTSDRIHIDVKGGYTPDVIRIAKGKQTRLTFLRTDPSSCLEEVVIPDFRIRKFLPLNREVTVEITPEKSGSYEISCGMNMFHGKIIVD
jgi:plastocyanin domain-containing protein